MQKYSKVQLDEFCKLINYAWDNKSKIKSLSIKYIKCIHQVVESLDQGTLRSSYYNLYISKWEVNEIAKKAILLYFLINDSKEINFGPGYYSYDKIPLKSNFQNTRVVPGAIVRYGTFIGPRVVLMPSFINIGSYIDEGTMIDIWACIGSCAQIGKNVHISAGTVIGGVLEPLNESPVIIEDNVFVGANCTIVEGIIIKKNSVIASGTHITGSTKIIDAHSGTEYKGLIPEDSIVVSGTRPKKFPKGIININCAYIIGKRDKSTTSKVALNQILR